MPITARDIRSQTVGCRFKPWTLNWWAGRYHGSTHTIDLQDPLRTTTSTGLIHEANEAVKSKRLLKSSFWPRYKRFVGGSENGYGQKPHSVCLSAIRCDPNKRFVKDGDALALRWHPDRRREGNTAKFQTLCEAWHVLSSSYPTEF